MQVPVVGRGSVTLLRVIVQSHLVGSSQGAATSHGINQLPIESMLKTNLIRSCYDSTSRTKFYKLYQRCSARYDTFSSSQVPCVMLYTCHFDFVVHLMVHEFLISYCYVVIYFICARFRQQCLVTWVVVSWMKLCVTFCSTCTTRSSHCSSVCLVAMASEHLAHPPCFQLFSIRFAVLY